MLHFPVWKTTLILATVVLGILCTAPNFFAKEAVENWPDWLPGRQLVLGLDLQGGAYLLYEIDKADFKANRIKALKADVRRSLRERPRISYRNLKEIDNGVRLRLRETADIGAARERLVNVQNILQDNLFGGVPVYEFDLAISEDGLVEMEFSESGFEQRLVSLVAQSIEVVRRRIDEFGTTEPGIQRQGTDRILVEAPGVDDPERLKALIGQTAQLTFHMVDSTTSPEDTPPIGMVVMPGYTSEADLYVVDEVPLLSGDDLVDAQAAFEQQTNEPVVTFRLNTSGAVKFGDVTSRNVGQLFAIALDDKVITAPSIREPIHGGSGQISGQFTIESANDLAVLLRAGALPAKLNILEERTVGPGLGADSIEAGRIASIIAMVLVIAFMIMAYGSFGIIADLALAANVALVFGALSALGATLTLPGIAGIVLTVGMAVDANVLIYERIREEVRLGRSPVMAIDAGYSRALTTILDANITTFIAAAILFQLGSGPIKGFAVTLAIGILTTIFTAFVFSRFLVAMWIRWRRPQKLAI